MKEYRNWFFRWRKNIDGKLNKNGEPINNFDLKGKVITDPPNQDLYLLSKIMKIKLNNGNEETISLCAKQLLLKGTKLKNIKHWNCGICWT